MIRCGVHTMSFALGTGVKLGGVINHLTLIVVSFGRCVVFGAKVGCPPGLMVYWFSFCNGFPFRVKKKNMMGGQLGLSNFICIP